MCNFRKQWQISPLSIACLFRTMAAFSAILTLAGGLFHTITLSDVLQRHKSTGEIFQTVWTNRRFGLKIVFLGDSIKPVKSEIMAYLNHCSLKKKYRVVYKRRGGHVWNDFSNWGSFWGNTSWRSLLTHCPTTGFRCAPLCDQAMALHTRAEQASEELPMFEEKYHWDESSCLLFNLETVRLHWK